MASASAAVTMVSMPLPFAGLKRPLAFQPMGLLPRATSTMSRSSPCLVVRASSSPSPVREHAVAGLTAAALAAALVIPEVAEAAQPGISPSLKNFLLSIVAGGVVLGVLIGAVIGVANFDPVKRT